MFDRVWGMSMSEITNMPVSEMTALGREFSDLLFSLPFQVPQDFLYLTRCVGILSGLCTGLDPNFDPWHEVAPFAQSLLDRARYPPAGRPAAQIHPARPAESANDPSAALRREPRTSCFMPLIDNVPATWPICRRWRMTCCAAPTGAI